MASSTLNSTHGKFQLKWSLAKKVSGLALVYLLLLMSVTGYLYSTMRQVAAEVSDLAETELPSMKMVNTIDQQQLLQHLAFEQIAKMSIAHSDTVNRNRALTDFDNHERLAGEALQNALQTAERRPARARNTAALQKSYDPSRRVTRISQILRDRPWDSANAGKADEVERFAYEVEKASVDLTTQTESLVADIESFAQESVTAARAHEASAANIILGLGDLAGTAIGAGLSLVFVGGLRKSVTGLTGMAVHISEGNLQQEKLLISTSDELGQLSLIFNDMLDNLRENVRQSRAGAEALSAAVAEILASTQEQAAGTSEQAAAVQETTATMEEISQSGSQVSERARQVAAAAEATATATSVGLDAVQNANKVMNLIQEQSEAVAENIVALSEKTQAVGAIIATVNDIAEQSNLLALNAAIEAAVG